MTRRGDDRGAVLLIVLAFMAFMGMVIMAVLNFSDASFRLSSSTRDTQQRATAADGGIKYALAALIADPSVCGPMGLVPPVPVLLPAPPEVNGFRPEVRCERRPTTVFTDSVGWGLYLTDPAGQITATDDAVAGNSKRVIEGPVYNHSISAPWDLQANLLVRDGMVLQRITDQGCATAQDIRLLLRGTAAFACTPPVRAPVEPVATQPLPSSPELLASRSPDGDGHPACRVFEPGRYAQRPNLVGRNYFRSGVYFFERGVGDIDGVDVLGGTRPAIETTVLAELETMPCRVPGDSGGVQFIIGTDGYVAAGGGARVELHSMARGDTAGTTIYQLRPSDPAGWSSFASTVAVDHGSALLRSGRTGNASLVVHGLVYAPAGAVDLAGAGADTVQIRGGMVAAKVRLSAVDTMAEPGVLVAAGEAFVAEKFVLSAVVTGGDGATVSTSAVVRLPADDPTNPIIYSWTVT